MKYTMYKIDDTKCKIVSKKDIIFESDISIYFYRTFPKFYGYIQPPQILINFCDVYPN